MTAERRATQPRDRASAAILTFLIADVRGYTRFTETHGDEAAAGLAAAFAEIVREGVEAWDGSVVELRGDEALAVFGSARNALRAAAELQAVFADEVALHPELPLVVGIGLDAGEAVPIEGGYRGGALNLAARLCASAEGGDVLASAGVIHLARAVPELALVARRGLTLKGIDGPIDAYSVTARRDGLVPRLALAASDRRDLDRGRHRLPPELDPVIPLVGRDRVARSLRWAWRTARRGRGGVVVVSGGRGSGRTRVAAEPALVAAHDGARVAYLRGQLDRSVPGDPDGALADLPAERRDERGEDREQADVALCVVDDLDAAPPEQLDRLLTEIGRLARRALVVATVDEGAGEGVIRQVRRRVPQVEGLREVGLPALDEGAVGEICALYAGGRGGPLPVRTILEASRGVPARVHELAIEWASADAAERLDRTTTAVAKRRRGLRHVEAEVSTNVIDFQRARAQATIYRRGGGDGGDEATPFKGLASFGIQDADLFFGRERLVAELVGRLAGASFLGVVGSSGSGKSSALMAGLVPALASGVLPGSDGWVRVVVRPGAHPGRELDRAAYAALPEAVRARMRTTDVWIDAVAPHLQGRTLLVIVDQFEEVFTACQDEDERRSFVDGLVRACISGHAIVVVAVRADFYGQLATYPALAARLAENHVLVGAMTPSEYARAIEQPAALVGVRVERALVEALVDDVGDEPGGLPLLSTALLELWERREGRLLTTSLHAATGGVRGAVARLAEGAYGRLTEPQQAAARAILLRLASGEGDAAVRRRVELAEFDSATQPDVAVALDAMIEARLLTSGEGTLEIAHEAVLREWPRLREWLDEDRVGRQLREHITQTAKTWQASGREPGELYRGARLAAALEWTGSHDVELNELERAFLRESRVAAEREEDRQRRTNRRLRALLAGVALLSVLALGAGGVALWLRGQAEHAAAVAEQQRAAAQQAALVSEAERVGAEGLQQDLDRSLLLARLGVRLHDARATRANLLTAVVRSASVEHVWRPLPGRLTGVAVSPDGSRLLVRNDSRTLAVVDAGEGSVAWQLDAGEQALTIDALFGGADVAAFAPDGSVMVSRVEPRRLEFRDASSGAPTARPSMLFPAAVDAVAWSPDGRAVAASDIGGGRVDVLDGASGRVLREIEPPDGTSFVDVRLYRDGHVLGLLHDGPLPDDAFEAFSGPLTYAWWRPFGQAPVAEVRRPAGAAQWPFDVSPDLATLALGGPDGSVTLHDLTTGRTRTTKGQHVGEVTTLAFSADSRRLVSAGRDRVASVWEVSTGAVVDRLVGHSGEVLAAAFGRGDHRDTVYTVGTDGAVIAWDVSHRRGFGRAFSVGDHAEGLAAPAFAISPDSRLIAVPQGDGGVVIRDLRDGALRASISGGGDPALDVDFSPDGRLLAVADAGEDVVRIYETADWRRVDGWPPATRPSPGTIAGSVAFSPDGMLLALGTGDGQVYVWNTRTGEPTAKPLVSGGTVMDVAFSPRSDLLAAAVTGRVTSFGVVWRIPDGRRLYSVDAAPTPQAPTTGIAFSPDGSTLVTAGGGEVRYWDPVTGAAAGATLVSAGGSLDSVRYDPSGTLLVAADEFGAVRLLDARSRALSGPPLPGARQAAAAAAFTPDGRRVVAVQGTGTAFAWDATVESWVARACAVAGRELTEAEWTEFVPDRPYASVCP